MRLSTIASLAIVGSIFTGSAFAGTVSDHFTGSSLDAGWNITTSNVNKYKYTVASSRVTFSDGDPVDPPRADTNNPSAIDVTGDGQFGEVFLTRSISSFIPAVSGLSSDFALTFDFGWDNSPGTPAGSLNAYPTYLVTLLNASDVVIASIGFRDGSGGDSPRSRAVIGAGAYTETGAVPISSTGDQITITRDALGNISFGWTGPGAPTAGVPAGTFPFPTGVNTDTVAKVQIDFAHFRFDGSSSKLGELWADQVSLSSSQIPEPASLGLLGLGAVVMLRRKQM